jgi:hypothetical protein
MVLAAQQTFNWGYEAGSLLFGFGGLWFNYGYLRSQRAINSTYQTPAWLQSGGIAGSIFFLGCALIIGVSPLIHHKVSFFGIVGAVLAFIGALVCITSVVCLIMVWLGRTPKFLSSNKTNS